MRGLVFDRCYPSTFPQVAVATPGTTAATIDSPIWPAIRYTIISGFNGADICGTDTVDTDDTRVQIDVVAKGYGAMVTLRDQVIAALQTTFPPCTRDGYFETYDADTKTHRGVLDFVFYASAGGGSP